MRVGLVKTPSSEVLLKMRGHLKKSGGFGEYCPRFEMSLPEISWTEPKEVSSNPRKCQLLSLDLRSRNGGEEFALHRLKA